MRKILSPAASFGIRDMARVWIKFLSEPRAGGGGGGQYVWGYTRRAGWTGIRVRAGASVVPSMPRVGGCRAGGGLEINKM